MGVALWGTACSDVVGPTGGVEVVGFDPVPPTSLTVGETVVLHPVPLDGNGQVMDIVCTTKFESHDPSVLTVNNQGVVTAVAPGSAEITVQLNGVPTVIGITVDPEPEPDPIPLALSVDDVEWTAEEGGEAPAPEMVEVTSLGQDEVMGLSVSIEYGEGEPEGWLVAELHRDETPADVELRASVEELTAGTYTAWVTVTGHGAYPATAQARLVVEEAEDPDDENGEGENGDGENGDDENGDPGDGDDNGDDQGDDENGDPGNGDDDGDENGDGENGDPGDGDDNGDENGDDNGDDDNGGPGDGDDNGDDENGGPGDGDDNGDENGDDDGDGDDPVDPDPSPLALSAEDVEFAAQEGGDAPAPEMVAVTSLGDDEVTRLALSIEYGEGEPEGWLAAELHGDETPADLELTASVEELTPGSYAAWVTVTGDDAEPATTQVRLVVEEAEAVVVGLQAELGGELMDTEDVLALELTQVLSDPALELTVWALYSDGSQEDVTHAAAITTSDPLLQVDGSGVLMLADLLAKALTDPEHYLNVEYEGFQTEVGLRLDVESLASLPIVGVELEELTGEDMELEVGTELPQIMAALDDGAGGTAELIIPAAHGEVEWVIEGAEVTGILAPLVNPLLAALGNLVGDVITITDGVVTSLNLSLLDEVLTLLGGSLTVDVSAIVDGLVSEGIHMIISQ